MSIEIGSKTKGKVTGITKFGAFIELEDGNTGLCHISEISSSYVKDISNYVNEGDEVEVKVLKIDGDKISLSIKQAKAPKAKAKTNSKKKTRYKKKPRRRRNNKSFEDMMSDFLSTSSEKLKDINTKK